MSDPHAATLDVSHEYLTLWSEVLDDTPRVLRERVAALVDGIAAELADIFYERLGQHPHAKLFLDNDLVNQRLRAAMTRWVRQLFATLDASQLPAAIGQQIQVGIVHARINLPAELMQMGFHVIARALRQRCAAVFPDATERVAAVAYVMDVFHITDSLMLSSFVRDLRTRVKKEEAYRVISMEHDAGLERERQRAALSEWANAFLMSIHLRGRRASAGTLGSSEFGLWMKHKAAIFFDAIPESSEVFDVIRMIDEVHVPQLLSRDTDPDTADRLIEDFERQIEFIRYLVGDLFSRLGKITLGRDTVTRLLNQRYLPTILGMEIGGQAAKGHPFSVVLVRVDDLREILALDDNDGRDLLMQQISVAVVESVRTGDHAFRYGDLEFLIVCVETNRAQAEIIADDLRLRIRALVFHIHSRTINQLSVSVGVAQFQGHPDYQQLLRRAESAVAQATVEGGNRVVLR